MADFWGSMTSGFNRGVPLGVRFAERGQEKAEREQERQEDLDYRNEILGMRKSEADRDKTRFSRETEEYDAKQLSKRARNAAVAADALWQNGQKQQAVRIISDFYNKELPNGDEVQVAIKDHDPSSQLWQDPKFKDSEIAVVSKKFGPMGFKDWEKMKPVLFSLTGETEIAEAKKQADTVVSAMNAKEQPFEARDGRMYIQTWKLGVGGIPERGEDMPYVGKAKSGALQAKVGDYERTMGRAATEQEKMALGGVKTEDKGKDYSGRLKDINTTYGILSKQFTGKAGMMFTESGLETAESQNAYDKALDLVLRKGRGEKLSEVEQRKVIPAGEFIKFVNTARGYMQGENYGLPGVPSKRQGLSTESDFDPEGSDYDEATAKKHGMKRVDGHMGSVVKIGQDKFLVLKGRKHETWDKTVAAEEKRGYKIIKDKDGRYYSVPKEKPVEKNPKKTKPSKRTGLKESEYMKGMPTPISEGIGESFVKEPKPKEPDTGPLTMEQITDLTDKEFMDYTEKYPAAKEVYKAYANELYK